MLNRLLVGALSIGTFSQCFAYTLQEFIAVYDATDYEDRLKFHTEYKHKGWYERSKTEEKKAYINYNYIKPLSNGYVSAWSKHVVFNDLSQDGLGVGDYSMINYTYDCSNETSKLMSSTYYQVKTGKVIKHYNHAPYSSFEVVVPNSVGEELMLTACMFDYAKRNL